MRHCFMSSVGLAGWFFLARLRGLRSSSACSRRLIWLRRYNHQTTPTTTTMTRSLDRLGVNIGPFSGGHRAGSRQAPVVIAAFSAPEPVPTSAENSLGTHNQRQRGAVAQDSLQDRPEAAVRLVQDEAWQQH